LELAATDTSALLLPQSHRAARTVSAAMTPKSYECPKCHIVSYNPNDVANFYCGRCHQFADDLRNEEVTDFKHITTLKLTRKDCWTLALLALADSGNPDWRLVHGWITSTFTGEPIQHAWCEAPAVATYEDGSQGPVTVAVDHTQVDERARIYPAELMYEKTSARDMQRFTLTEAIRNALAAGHDGPWQDITDR
jgi:hypothetical protein